MTVTQPQILGLFYMVLYLLFLGILYQGAKKYKERRFIQEVLQTVGDRTEMLDEDCRILYLTCTNPGFKQMNGAVSQYRGNMAIVLEGPEWFIRNKKFSWRRHHVISAQQLTQVPLHFKNTMKLYCRRTGKWLEAEEAARYLQAHYLMREPDESAI